MKTSMVPELMNSQNIKIFDDNLVPVNICEKSFFLFDNNLFKNPSVTIDVFEAGRFKEVEIKRIQLPEVEKAGYRLVSLSVVNRPNIKNYKGQKTVYMFKRLSDPLEGSTEMFRIPKDHVLEMDIINKRLRIRGKNSYPYIKNENASKWVEIIDDKPTASPKS